jgi:RNA polymerase sigma factor (sigma-70 family)
VPQESPEPGVPFEQTLASVKVPKISADDIGSYVNANLGRLERFVDRELQFRCANEELPEDGLSTSEVVNEVIARALGDQERPEKLSLEPWLYRLALQAMNEMTARLDELESSVNLEPGGRRPSVETSDEPWTRESVIPDRSTSTPEQAAYSDEVIALVQAALGSADRIDREAFLLYGIEGFSLAEIAAITGRQTEAVRESVQRARDCVRSAPSIAHEFHGELLAKTQI